MDQAPRDGVPDRFANVLPGRVEDGGDLLPREPSRPAGEKPLIALGQPALATRPRNLFHDHAASRAIDPPHGVHEHHGDLPQRHKFEPPLGEAVVAGPPPAAARTDGAAIGPRRDRHFDRQMRRVLLPPRLAVDERLVTFDPVEDSLQLHPALTPRGEALATPSLLGTRAGCTSSSSSRRSARFSLPEQQRRGEGGWGSGGRDLGASWSLPPRPAKQRQFTHRFC
jgi:hypothetical protein